MDCNASPSAPAASGSNIEANIRRAHGTHAPRLRSDESWIEVSSRPSSSSLSSVADEIITEGLRVQHDSNLLRRRTRKRANDHIHTYGNRQSYAGTSSQEEYEESESESDRIMTSSNEALPRSPLRHEWRPTGPQFTLSSASSDNAYASEDADDNENATAIGLRRGEEYFTPQPNVFSHPPTASRASSQQQSTNSYFSERPVRPSQRGSYATREQHSPYNAISPSHQADHDAALRASLSTLLSCAAAARGLPKSNQQALQASTRPVTSNRVDPTSIGLIPESAVYGSPAKPATQSSQKSAESSAVASPDKTKRKVTSSTAQRSNSKDRRTTKKARKTSANWTPATMEDVNPTLLTWFVGAGVVVLISALSFSAGYITGREHGRAEAIELGMGAGEVGRCGKEAMVAGAGRGLRRLRWTDAASSMVS
ncbi:hypothetical protein, variant [Verruconis gallopava]|uniref:Uncharacterized protein n=1 Tax=Verruconis gallopava TaxID=253628 RepID=A0A0D1Z4Q1_9PEZI|nr:hypothetical protein, variant [Verruconis gallopava]KIW07937.1 hypothetical protein, variant [Verruconis gallopava]